MKPHTLLLLSLLITVTTAFAANKLPQNNIVNKTLPENALPKGIIKLDGRNAPPLALKDIDGESYDIIDSRGKWVFVHFWATWCGPCRREIPTIQDITAKFKNSNLDIAVVNTAESEDTVFSFLGLLAPDITPLMDTDGLITERWQPRGLPATYFVDPQGKLRYLALGGRPWNESVYLTFLKQLNQQSAKN